MTAAHCVRDFTGSLMNLLYIRIGIHNLNERIIPQKYVKVNRILWDKRYDSGNSPSRVGDIAFIELDRSLQFNAYVQPGLCFLIEIIKKNF